MYQLILQGVLKALAMKIIKGVGQFRLLLLLIYVISKI